MDCNRKILCDMGYMLDWSNTSSENWKLKANQGMIIYPVTRIYKNMIFAEGVNVPFTFKKRV